MAKCKFSQKEIDIMILKYREGNSCTKIAKLLNTSPNTVSKYLKIYGIKITNYQNSLSFKNIDIISDYNNGLSITKICAKYHTSALTVRKRLKNNSIPIINYQNVTKFDEHIFDVINTEEKAYWLGFIFADGNISSHSEDKKSRYQFELSLSLKDKSHLDKFNIFMKHRYNNTRCDSFRCRWSVGNKHLWETLNSYGCTPNKSLTLKFPDESIFKDKSLIRHFIRGYFDGDGCISYGINLIASMLGTIQFLQYIQKLTWPKTLYSNHGSIYTFSLTFSGVKSLTFLYYLYFNSNIYLDRKYQKFLQFKDCRFKEKSLKLLESKIGEGWDANPELITILNES